MNIQDWAWAITIFMSGISTLIITQRRQNESMRQQIESMISKRLDDIQSGVDKLVKRSEDHSTRITRIETVFEMNGCVESPNCDRRKRGL